MAVQTNIHTVSLVSVANLTALTMPRFIQWDAGAAGISLCSAHERADGVVCNAPAIGAPGEVAVGPGKVRIESGAAIAIGALLASDAVGRAVPSTVYAGEPILGRALSVAGAAGQEITMLYFGPGGGGTD